MTSSIQNFAQLSHHDICMYNKSFQWGGNKHLCPGCFLLDQYAQDHIEKKLFVLQVDIDK